jgi:succinate dehydrogenase flavin-adding protein (antitoxin of CptAB toxin-antitoxin module)
MTKDEVLRKKIAYRSAQRSMREVELVLRAFNRHYVARLSYDALLDFNDLLANENISDRDLYSWITGGTLLFASD